MFRVLRVGDPHAKVSNLDEMKKLIEFVFNVAIHNKVNRIELLGDLFHTHAVLRLEVQEFWLWALNYLSDAVQVVVLVGNHDMSGNYQSKFSALSMYNELCKKNLIIVDSPFKSWGEKIAYMPYTHDHSEFRRHANDLAEAGAKVLVCHQTIKGSKYENGFEALDGIDLAGWSERYTHIISGHIHTEQEFDKVIYPGTAMWQSTADANKRKGIWIFDHDEEGRIIQKEFIPTNNIVTAIHEVTFKEGEEAPVIPEGKVALLLIGSSEWVRKQKEIYKDKIALKSKLTDVKQPQLRQAGTSFEDFLRNYFPATMNKEHLVVLAKEFGIV